MTELEGDDWNLECSDDELSKAGTTIGNNWVVEASELEVLYNKIDENGTLTLEWKCPGRRAPSPVNIDKEAKVELPQSPVKEKSDFDSMDEINSQRLRVRREEEDKLRGSAKKKTTSFDGILPNMTRYKRIEQMVKKATNPTTSASPSNS